LSHSTNIAIVVIHDGLCLDNDSWRVVLDQFKPRVERLLHNMNLPNVQCIMFAAPADGCELNACACPTYMAFTPPQHDGYNCGVIAMAVLHSLLSGNDPRCASHWDFDTYRMGMAWHIASMAMHGHATEMVSSPSPSLYATPHDTLLSTVNYRRTVVTTHM
jgi:hypothetical protein